MSGLDDLELALAGRPATRGDVDAAKRPLPASGTHAARLAAIPAAGLLWKETDTGLIYLGSGSTWGIFKGDGMVRKTALETVNNSAVLQNDDHLFFPIEANEVWFVEALLDVTGVSVNADFKWGLSVPAGATYKMNLGSNSGGVGSGSTASGVVTTSIASGGSNANSFQSLVAQIINGATAGPVTLQWSQNTATAEDSTVNPNSLLRLRRLA